MSYSKKKVTKKNNGTRISKLDEIDKLPDFPDFSEVLTLPWRDWICSADYHLPFLNKPLFKQMLKDARDRKLTKLLIAGDFFDLNAFSKFYCHYPVEWKKEREFAKEVVKILINNFSEIVFMASNHEIRYLKNMINPCGDIEDLYSVIGIDNRKYPVTLKNQCIVDNFIVIHPKNARHNQLSFAREISNIHKEKHIVIAHAHMQSQAIDPAGTHWLIDIGLMGDANKIEYKNMMVTGHYAWNSGYMLVEDGRPELKWDESKIKR